MTETTIPNRESIFIESCEDNRKIYNNGKCIFDTENEYYYFDLNSEPLNDKCYKINELPNNKNITFAI